MSDLISRQQAIDALTELRKKTVASDSFRLGIYYSIEEIKNVPPAQPERKTARWEILYPNHTYKYHCSECGANHKYMFDFCPSCGAYMGDENDAIS